MVEGLYMTNKDKIRKIPSNFVTNRDDWMSAFRHNIDIFITNKVYTVREISEKADIPFSTLSAFLYGDATDCKLSTAVKLARALGISIDELVGAGTIEEETRECVAMSRSLDQHHRNVIRGFVRHQYNMHANTPEKIKRISVLLPECQSGSLRTTTASEPMDITHLPAAIRSNACVGVRIPCDHYEPHYFQDEVILLGADREAHNGERCVVRYAGNLYICTKRIEHPGGKELIKYMSLMDSRQVLFTREEIDDKCGYVIGFLSPDGNWGDR
jgi:hypothetical protein